MPEKPFNELNKRQRNSKLINFSFKTNNKSHKHQFTEELWHRMYFTKKLKIKLGLHLLYQACEPHDIEHYFANKHLPLNTSLASNEFLILIRLVSLGEVFQIQAFVFAILIEASISLGFCHTHITWEWSCSSFLMGKHCALGTPGKVCVLFKAVWNLPNRCFVSNSQLFLCLPFWKHMVYFVREVEISLVVPTCWPQKET